MTHSHPLRLLATASLFAVLACGEAKPEAAPVTAESLAASLSGGRTDPVCRSRGPRGEYLGPVPGAQFCQWPTVTRGAEFSTVTARRDSVLGWGSLTMERLFTDTARATVFLDSLHGAFVAAGLLPHRCSTGGRRWQADGIVIQTMPPVARSSGGYVLNLYAAGLPGAIPSLYCPDAPPPPLRDPRARTS